MYSTTRLNPLQSTSPTEDKPIELAKPNGLIREKYKAITIMHKRVQRRLKYFS
jgi:hypothetical protein